MELTQEAREKLFARQRAAVERQRARNAEKLADPEYRQKQVDKARETQERQREKRLLQLQSPEYWEKRREIIARKRSTALNTSAKPRKAIKSRGNKGRTPTAAERRIMDKLGALPCIACLIHGKVSPLISLHHIDGRTAPDAHAHVLPLCNFHHQHAAPADIREQYPWLLPVHADGNVGGPAEFEKANGTQLNLLAEAYKRAGIECLKN